MFFWNNILSSIFVLVRSKFLICLIHCSQATNAEATNESDEKVGEDQDVAEAEGGDQQPEATEAAAEEEVAMAPYLVFADEVAEQYEDMVKSSSDSVERPG